MAEKKKRASEEAKQAAAEAVQFREDVAFLTKETAALLDEIRTERSFRFKNDEETERLNGELKKARDLHENEV